MTRYYLAVAIALAVGLAGCGSGGGDLGTATSTGDTTGGSSSITADDFSRMTSDATTSSDTGAVSGTVVDDAGQPVPGATVTVTAAGRQAAPPSFSTVCDQSGQYAIGNMRPGTYQMTFSHEGIGDVETTVQVRPGQHQQTGHHQLRPGAGQGGGGNFQHGGGLTDAGAIVGTVVDETGAPLARVRLDIGRRMHAMTGEAGAFAFGPLAAGTYTVTCHAEGYQAEEQDAEVQAGQAAQIEFQLEPGDDGDPQIRPARVGGTVVDAKTDEPLADIPVHLTDGRDTVATDESGEFLFEAVRPGTRVLLIRVDGYRPYVEPLRLPEGAEIRVPVRLVPLPPQDEVGRGTLQVLVLDKETGDPIRGAALAIDDHGPFFTNADGVVEVTDVPEGEHRIRVGARGYEPNHDEIEIVADEVTEVTLQLEAHEPGHDGGPIGGPGGGPGGGIDDHGPRPNL